MVNTRSASRSASLAPEAPPTVLGTDTGTPTTTSRPRNVAKTPRRTTAAPSAIPSSPTASAMLDPATLPSRYPTQLWSHTPTAKTWLWLAISIPLVVWDSAYMLLRPATMKGGALHWPLFVPYELYGRVDHVYGWKAYNARDGFPAAQSWMNVVETALYLSYVYLTLTTEAAAAATTAAESRSRALAASSRGLSPRTTVRRGALALLIGFSAAVMTLSKTALYWLNEYSGGFANIGHNPWRDILVLWIFTNGAWFVGSFYMICSMGADIVNGLALASGEGLEPVKTE